MNYVGMRVKPGRAYNCAAANCADARRVEANKARRENFGSFFICSDVCELRRLFGAVSKNAFEVDRRNDQNSRGSKRVTAVGFDMGVDLLKYDINQGIN